MKKIILLSAMALFAVSCNKTSAPSADAKAISFAPSVSVSQSKAAITETALPQNGALGIYASKYKNSEGHSWAVEPYINNNLLVYGASTSGTFEKAPLLYYWPTASEDSKMNFYAYFDPSRNMTIKREASGSPKAEYALSIKPSTQMDFLWADPVIGRNGTEINNLVPLKFKHALSQLHFKFKSKVSEATLVSVKIHTPTTADIDITNGAISEIAANEYLTIDSKNFATTASPITAPADNALSTEFFATILIPHAIKTTSLFEITYTYKDIVTNKVVRATANIGLAQELNVLAGNIYTISIDLTQNSIIFDVPTVTPWVDVNGGNITIK